MNILAPDILANIYVDMNALWATSPPLPFWTADSATLANWLTSTQTLRNKKYVVPVEMVELGLTSVSPILVYLNPITIPSGCTFTHDDLHTLHTSAPPSGFYTGDPPGGSFVVEPGGSAFLTAGCRIEFEPGTLIEPGGYLLATIIPAGPTFCSSQGPVASPQNLARVENLPVNYTNSQLRFKIYPNPATNSFWVELLDEEDAGSIQIEVFDFSGHRLMHQNRKMVNRAEILISDQPSGLYLVKLTKGNLTGNQTVVLQ